MENTRTPDKQYVLAEDWRYRTAVEEAKADPKCKRAGGFCIWQGGTYGDDYYYLPLTETPEDWEDVFVKEYVFAPPKQVA